VREETGLRATIGAPLVVLEQSYVEKGTGEEGFSAQYVVYAARAAGDISDASRLGVHEAEISAAEWFETLPENLHDGDVLRPYLRA
jgi:8-oxo-dGTP diphosphatase